MSIDDVQTLTDGQANSKALGFQFFFDRLCEAEGVPDEAVLRGYNILHALSLSKELPLNQWRFLRDSVEYRSLKNRLPQESVVLLETMELDMLEALASNNVTVSRKIALKLLKSDAPVRSKMNAAIVLLDQVDSAQSSDSATEMLQAVSSSISLENLAAGNLAKGLPVAKQLSDRLLNHGFIDKASQTIDVLDKLAPNDLQVQFLDARLLAKQGKWDEAVVGFRSIAARTTVGSDIWLDAKMGQVESLSHVDVDIAKAVVVQVYELVDDLPIERKELLDAILNGR